MANLSVVCYPSPNKAKAHAVCSAFAEGCGGFVASAQRLLPGAAFFYGVVSETLALWKQAIREERDWFYADNAYFDRGRQAYFRVTRNALQVSARCMPSYTRFDALGAKVYPWRTEGAHIVLCEQSLQFMNLCGYGDGWVVAAERKLREFTDRPLRIRRWNRDKGKASITLRDDLNGAWALVTHMSAAANEALLRGIPVFATGACAASPFACDDLSLIETPLIKEGRRDWAAGLAANQWTLDEMRSGKCWSDLQGALQCENITLN